jgi:hypothetical protein
MVVFLTQSMRKNIHNLIKNRIKGHGRGWIFTPKEFVDLANKTAVDKALSRLAAEHFIRRLSSGLYDYPRKDRRFGLLAPDPDLVASALASRTQSKIQISGARAANLLGLTAQVPAQLVYLTDGPSRRFKIGGQTIILRHAAVSKFPKAGTPAGLAVQAIRAMGSRFDRDIIVRTLRRHLDEKSKKDLYQLKPQLPGWMGTVIDLIGRTDE